MVSQILGSADSGWAVEKRGTVKMLDGLKRSRTKIWGSGFSGRERGMEKRRNQWEGTGQWRAEQRGQVREWEAVKMWGSSNLESGSR